MNIPENLKNIITQKIIIKENAGPELKAFFKGRFQGAHGFVICDYNTKEIADKYFISSDRSLCCIDIRSHHADEIMIEICDDIVKNKDYDYFIACGAGTIHDITRVIAHKYNKPFISFPTAASVDGFVSSVAPITTKSGMKITLPSAAPVALFADINVLADAPRRLTASGTGDLIGKYNSLADWRIANLLLGEEMPDDVVNLEYTAINKLKGSLAEYAENKDNHELYKKFCAELLEALVLSGLCMQSVGNSRPASGAEHHIAHFFEMNMLEKNDYLHGENVAIGAVICAELYHRFLSSDNIKFIENYAADEILVKKYYGDLSGDVMKENEPAYLHKITPEVFYENLGRIKNIIKDIPQAYEINKMLAQISDEFKNICGISAEVKEHALKLAPYVRNRFTLLKLCRCLEF